MQLITIVIAFLPGIGMVALIWWTISRGARAQQSPGKEKVHTATGASRIPRELNTPPRIDLKRVFNSSSTRRLKEICKQMPIEDMSLYPSTDTEVRWLVDLSFGMARYLASEQVPREYGDMIISRVVDRVCQHDPRKIDDTWSFSIKDL
jgi:hypothetical protein